MSAEAIFEALGELDEGLIREGREIPARIRRPRKTLLLAAVIVILAVLLAAGAYASPVLRRILTANGDEILFDENGDWIMWNSGREVCGVEEGRIFLHVDGKDLDLTEKCSDTAYYAWERTYDDGTRHLILVGGTPEAMGYIDLKFHLGGSISVNMPCFYDYKNAPWVGKAERAYGLEYLKLTGEPDYGDLAVPSAKELIEHGYPVNGRGESYGPAGYEMWLGEPDLVLSRGKNGVLGYVRQSESEEASGGSVSTPEEAVAWNEYAMNRGPVEIPVYREDGETVVDWFVIG